MADIVEKIKEGLNLNPELQEKLSSMMTKFLELDEEGKAEFTETVKESFNKKLSEYTSNNWMKGFWMLSRSYVALVVAIILILFVFVFFGYKLYKSLVERERKREEKRKLRQLKKKK